MKKLLLLIFLIPFFTISQSNLNAYKYGIIEGTYIIQLGNVLNEIGLQPILINETLPEELVSNYCLAVTVDFKYYRGGGSIPSYIADIVFYNCNGSAVFSSSVRKSFSFLTSSIKFKHISC